MALMLNASLSASDFTSTRLRVQTALGVRIITDSVCIDSWNMVSYTFCTDTAWLRHYMELAEQEFSKYPPGFLARAGVNRLVLGRDVVIQGQNRAAVPDPYKGCLFLSVNGAYQDSSDNYLVHVMHHELNHCSEAIYWGSMYHRWSEWSNANPEGFEYLGSGVQAYSSRETDWVSLTHPQAGFVNLYSTTAQEEDRSEVVACIMGDMARERLQQFALEDPILRQKIQMIIRFLNAISATTENYWTDLTAWAQ